MTTTAKTTKTPGLIARYELLSSSRAIVSYEDTNGDFHGGERVEILRANSSALYDACYSAASVRAEIKGMRLERFSEDA